MTRRAIVFWAWIAAPVAAWTAQLLVAYFLVSLACTKGVALPVAWHAVSVVAAALVALAIVATRRLRREALLGASFVASIATLGAAVFLVGVLLGELPLVLVPGCV